MMAYLTRLARLMRLARALAAHDALLPAEFAERYPPTLRFIAARIRKRDAEGGRPGERLARALEGLGPTTIKLGQFLATRADIVGAEVAQDLSRLQDRVPPFPLSEARAAIAEGLGRPVEDLFLEISPPVAAASIAQVHEGYIADPTADGGRRKVAVKVLRPGVGRQLLDDLAAFDLAARIGARLVPALKRLRPRAAIATLAKSVEMELDLRLEAAAASEMGENSAGDPQFRVPAIDWERTAERVLTVEWVDGVKLNDRAAVLAAGHDPKALATLVIQSFLAHALRDGFFHADMHPGNLFIADDGTLVAVDFGIMGRLDLAMRRFMAETLGGFLARDYRRIAQVHFDAGFVPARHSVEEFAQALRSIGEPVFGRPASEISMARLLAQLFRVTELFDMPLQPQLLLLQKTMVVVEGVARDLDPGHSIWESSRPVIESWMIDNLGPEAQLRSAADGVAVWGKVLADLPHTVRQLERLADIAAEGGVRVHPDSLKAIGETQAARAGGGRLALWAGAAALIVLALASL